MMRKTDFTFIPSVETVGNRAEVMIHGVRYKTGAGDSDAVSVYRDKTSYYVLAENERYDYIGLERISRATGDVEFDIFIQEESEEKDWLLGLCRRPTKIRFLLQWDM